MRFKVVTSLTLIALLVGVALAWRGTTRGLQSREPSNIKVMINQLPARNGVIPIEIIQPTIVSSAPHKLEDLTYILRNNSGKAVIAIALIKTISYEEGGKVYAQSRYSTMDAAFHSDVGGKPFLHGSQRTMESAGPLSFDEGVVIKEITLTVEYASYADQTVYGSGGEGERRINAMRQGARRYKGWLVQEYSRAGKTLATILPVIETPSIPEELKLDSDQTMGADRYRLQLLKTLKTKGAADVESYLNRPNR
jgi:hypothetical protein